MNDITITRTADVIAAEINGIKAQTRAVMLCGSIEIGRRLVEAKDMLEHGQWTDWLEKSVDYSPRTAQNLMKIFEEYGADQLPLFGDNAKTQALADLSYTQAVALLGLSADQREAFMEANDVTSMKTRELQEAIRKQKEAEDKAAAADKRATTAETKATTAETARASAEKALKDAQDKAKKDIDRLTAQLTEAKKAGASDEKLTEMKGELDEAKEEVRRLTEQLAEPVTVEATVKPDPAAVAVMKFGLQFDALVVNFRNLLTALGEIKVADADAGEKYKVVVTGLIGKMTEKLT
ncbi:MAG: DUF3102 domain-containing protein [Sporomusaceae bacterium]|nr:DUF3102 domain-containing protein [Sporomusaceae bacterium]